MNSPQAIIFKAFFSFTLINSHVNFARSQLHAAYGCCSATPCILRVRGRNWINRDSRFTDAAVVIRG
jgi:hypothetical protein